MRNKYFPVKALILKGGAISVDRACRMKDNKGEYYELLNENSRAPAPPNRNYIFRRGKGWMVMYYSPRKGVYIPLGKPNITLDGDKIIINYSSIKDEINTEKDKDGKTKELKGKTLIYDMLPYDLQTIALNEIRSAKEHFEDRGWFEKYGATMILFIGFFVVILGSVIFWVQALQPAFNSIPGTSLHVICNFTSNITYTGGAPPI